RAMLASLSARSEAVRPKPEPEPEDPAKAKSVVRHAFPAIVPPQPPPATWSDLLTVMNNQHAIIDNVGGKTVIASWGAIIARPNTIDRCLSRQVTSIPLVPAVSARRSRYGYGPTQWDTNIRDWGDEEEEEQPKPKPTVSTMPRGSHRGVGISNRW